MKIVPKATQNYEKRSLESWEIQLLRKSVFAIHPSPNALFFNPRHPESHPKINRKNNLETSMTNLFLLVRRYQKSCQNGSLNQQNIDKFQAWTSKCPPQCPWIGSGPPKTPKWSHQACQTTGLGAKHAKIHKIMKNGPWNHKNSEFCTSWFLQFIASKILSFPILEIHIQTQKPLEKETWKQAPQNTHLLVQGTQTKFKTRSLNQLKINKDPNLDLKVSFLVLPQCPRIDPGIPRSACNNAKNLKSQNNEQWSAAGGRGRSP